MPASRSGLILAGAYVVLSLVSIAFGYSFDNVEARVVLLQLPVLPALLLVDAVGLSRWASDVPWAVVFVLGIPAIAAGLYFTSKLIGGINPRVRLVIGSAVLLAALAALFWPVRR